MRSLDLKDLHVPNSKLRKALTPTMSNLTELMLSDQLDYSTTMYQTLATSCGKLEKLVCLGFLMHNSDITALGNGMPNLRELNLNHGPYSTMSLYWFNDSSAMVVQHCMPKLTKLNLSACHITRVGLVSLSQLESLQELNLQSCHELSDDCIRILSEGKCGRQLKVLNISYCKLNANSVLTSMADHPLPLTEFSITSYKWCSITDDGLQALLQSGKDLKTLRLFEMTDITDAGLAMIAETCTKLKTIVLSNLQKRNLNINKTGIDMIKHMASKPQVIYRYGRHVVF